MQTVGAQWLIVSLGGTALTVSLVQTATTLPTFLIGLPAGALGDILDRRKIMLARQAFMLVCAAVLGVLTITDDIGIPTVLALTFGIGLGSAVLRPSWQAVQPELVEREEIPQAAALNGVSMNMARAVGPAIGGVRGRGHERRRRLHRQRALVPRRDGRARALAAASRASPRSAPST